MNIDLLYNLFIQSTGVCTDTRKIKQDNIFFALKGDNFNGNEFVYQAFEKGAKICIIDEENYKINNNCLLVKDVLSTLQQLANYYRNQLSIPIIAITGSNGKTTTKELLAAVLREVFKVCYTKGNLNNHIGVPLTLLSIKPTDEIAIIEMGANHPKEIADLCKIAQPDFGYITNFGKAHLEGFGRIEGVIKAKSELYEYLKLNLKKVFINSDIKKQIELTKGMNTISFSIKGNKADFDFKSCNTNKSCLNYQNQSISSNLIGSYNETNLAIAITIGQYFGVSLNQIIKGISSYIPDNNRSQIIEQGKIKIILDAYNANPSSMEVALNHLAKQKGKKIAILGDMFELGSENKKEHEKVIKLAEKLLIDKVFVVGKNFYNTELKNNITQKFKDKEELTNFLKSNPIKSGTLLVKGSRGMALEGLLSSSNLL